MAFPLRNGLGVCGFYEVGLERKDGNVPALESLSWKNDFRCRQVLIRKQKSSDEQSPQSHPISAIHSQNPIGVAQALGWWEKNTASNMMEIKSTNQLVNELLDAGDRLVIVEFFSPGCGGCRSLHPKICQHAESNPSAVFLKVNYDHHKVMCQSLHIPVLPFFRLYRGAEGLVCSFSCTNKTIKKLKDAVAKHGIHHHIAGPGKGLEESELISLASNPDTHFSYQLQSLAEKFARSTFADSFGEDVEVAERVAAVSVRGTEGYFDA